MGYNEQQLHFEVYQEWGLRFLGNPVLLLSFFFSFSLLPCLPVLSTTPNSPIFTAGKKPPLLQTAELKVLDLATLRHIQQPSSLSRKGRFGDQTQFIALPQY